MSIQDLWYHLWQYLVLQLIASHFLNPLNHHHIYYIGMSTLCKSCYLPKTSHFLHLLLNLVSGVYISLALPFLFLYQFLFLFQLFSVILILVSWQFFLLLLLHIHVYASLYLLQFSSLPLLSALSSLGTFCLKCILAVQKVSTQSVLTSFGFLHLGPSVHHLIIYSSFRFLWYPSRQARIIYHQTQLGWEPLVHSSVYFWMLMLLLLLLPLLLLLLLRCCCSCCHCCCWCHHWFGFCRCAVSCYSSIGNLRGFQVPSRHE